MSNFLEKHADLYVLQEVVTEKLFGMNDPQFAVAKLCGGTALSRCWLNHRVSYDLDFFIPEGFSARKLAESMKAGGIDFKTKDIVDDIKKANQLHGYVVYNGAYLKVSFVEDAYFDVFPVIEKDFGPRIKVRTEPVAGLYHRKLRTVSGHGSEGDSFEGGRQKARDVFDLYVLSKTHLPLREFMASLPYAFPSMAFDNGLISMPWFDISSELSEMVCDDKWANAKDSEFLCKVLYEQIGALLIDEDRPEADEEPAQSKPRFSP